ncbi:MAG: hypothetical protein ACE5LU_07945 [Anaerolineae bacterium]
MNTQSRWRLVIGARGMVGLVLVACAALLLGSLGFRQMAGPVWGPFGLFPGRFRSNGERIYRMRPAIPGSPSRPRWPACGCGVRAW